MFLTISSRLKSLLVKYLKIANTHAKHSQKKPQQTNTKTRTQQNQEAKVSAFK